MRSVFKGVMVLLITLTALCVLANISSAVDVAEEAKMDVAEGDAAAMDPVQEEMMKKWQEYATPGADHEILNRMVGSWSHNVKWKMSAEGPEDESTGTSEIAWIMGGRFLQHKVSGTAQGQPFEGMGIIGFDNLKKQYDAIWLDNMGTGLMRSLGQYDPETKTLSEAGDMSCPMTGGTRHYRAVTKFIDDDHYMYETYTTDENGQEFRSMVISYTRK